MVTTRVCKEGEKARLQVDIVLYQVYWFISVFNSDATLILNLLLWQPFTFSFILFLFPLLPVFAQSAGMMESGLHDVVHVTAASGTPLPLSSYLFPLSSPPFTCS